MFEKIMAFFMSILVTLTGLFLPEIPEVKTENELSAYANIFEEYPIGDTVYVLDPSTFTTKGHRHTAVALQGLVARVSPQIFILSSALDTKNLEAIAKSGYAVSRTDENGNKWTLESLIVRFRDYITDSGYVLYRETPTAEGLNVATNYATLNGWLPVPEALEETVINLGLTKKKDISDDIYTYLFQWNFFEQNKDKFRKDAMIHLNYEMAGLRDAAIQQGFYTFYIDDDDGGKSFRKRVMEYFGDNAHVFGWVKYEVKFVDQASSAGNMISPSDHSYNVSLLSSLNAEIPEQKAAKDTYTDPDKHYCALVMSDGDNIQWVQNGYREFYKKISLENNFPVTWSFPPMLQDVSPVTVNMIYSDATTEDYFMAGVSGAGYIHPTQYPKKALADFTDITAEAMRKSGLNYVQLIDTTPENEIEEIKLTNTLKYYSRYENIKGGVVSLDPERYAGGQGKIWFVDDKPFITYRLSLWHPSGNMSEVTHEWLDAQAETVNSYPADINSINGYSVINIHPWTISIDSLSYFVSKLDEDVVLVTVDELMDMIKTNVPHESAEITQ